MFLGQSNEFGEAGGKNTPKQLMSHRYTDLFVYLLLLSLFSFFLQSKEKSFMLLYRAERNTGKHDKWDECVFLIPNLQVVKTAM